jgi:hypothetical protein
MTAIPSTSERLRSEFVRLLFVPAHRETDLFLEGSGVHHAQHNRDQFHFPRAFVSQLKSRGGLALSKISSINLVSIFRCSSSPSNPVYARRVDSSALGFSISSHRHSYKGLVFNRRISVHRFIINNRSLQPDSL